jgi:hypothetical protein
LIAWARDEIDEIKWRYFAPRPRHLNLLIFEFSLGGIAGRKHAKKRVGGNFFLLNFARAPSNWRVFCPVVLFLNNRSAPRGAKFYLLNFTPRSYLFACFRSAPLIFYLVDYRLFAWRGHWTKTRL